MGEEVIKGGRPAANLDFSVPEKPRTSTALNRNSAPQPHPLKYSNDHSNISTPTPISSSKLMSFLVLLAVAACAIYFFKTLENSAREKATSTKRLNAEAGTITSSPSSTSIRVEEVVASAQPNSQLQKNDSIPPEVPLSSPPQGKSGENLVSQQIQNARETPQLSAPIPLNSPEWQTQNPQQTSKVLSAEDIHTLKSVIFSTPMPAPMQGFTIGAVFDRESNNTGMGFAIFTTENAISSKIVTYAPRIFEGDARIRRFYGGTPIRFFSVTEDFMAFSVSVTNPNNSREVLPIAYYFKYDIKNNLITKFNVSFSPSAGTGIGLNSITSFVKNGKIIYVAITPNSNGGSYRKEYLIETPSIINSQLCYTDYLDSDRSNGGTCEQKGYAFK